VDKRFLRLATRVDSEDDSFSAVEAGSLSMGCFSMEEKRGAAIFSAKIKGDRCHRHL